MYVFMHAFKRVIDKSKHRLFYQVLFAIFNAIFHRLHGLLIGRLQIATIHANARMHDCMRVCIYHVCMNDECMYICTYVRTYVRTYVCMYVCNACM